MYWWTITIEVWPFFMGAESNAAQKAAGERHQKHLVQANDIQGALVLAETFVEGVRRNPAVWQAPIRSIVCNGEQRP